jgi:hypothetical protein
MTDGGAAVLLRPVVDRFDEHTTWGRRAADQRLLAAEQGATWHDGDRTQAWGLPDSPVPGRPVQATVLRASTTARNGITPYPEVHLLLVDDASRTLAALGRAGVEHGGMTRDDLERIWPRDGFAALERRGVLVEDVETRDLDELERRFPGAVPRRRMVYASSTAARIVVGLLGLGLVVSWLTSR